MTSYNDYRGAAETEWLRKGRELLADPYAAPEDFAAHAAAAHTEADGIEYGCDLLLSRQPAAARAYFAAAGQAAAEGA